MRSYSVNRPKLTAAMLVLLSIALASCDDLYHKAQKEIRNGKTFSFIAALTGGITPSYMAQGLRFNDIDMDEDMIGGSLDFTRAMDETDVMEYVLFWGNGSMPLFQIRFVGVTGTDQSIPLAAVPVPPMATNFLLYSRDMSGKLHPRPAQLEITDAVLKIVQDINPAGDSDPSELTVMDGKLWFVATNSSQRTIYGWQGGSFFPETIVGNAAFQNPDNLYAYNGTLYFSANDVGALYGNELWTSDGVSVPVMSDIYDTPSTSSSQPSGFCGFNNMVFFGASFPGTDGNPDREFFMFDGNWHFYAHINATESVIGPPYIPNPSTPNNFKVFNNKLYFSADDGYNGFELWAYEGGGPGILGTNIYRVSDISPGSGASFPADLVVYNGKLYFSANDGSANGTQLWAYIGSGEPYMIQYVYSGLIPSHMVVYNNKLYFQGTSPGEGAELWVYDNNNSMNPPMILADINIGGASAPQWLTVYRGKLFFYANNGANQCLWVYDDSLPVNVGTNPRIVATMPTLPRYLKVFNNGTEDYLCFQANDATNGVELWAYYER
jgi:trimeric autotransporter adhesin